MSGEKKQRIWELDALRGFLMLFVILSHLRYYIDAMITPLQVPRAVEFVFHNGGVLFILLSGLCATLGSRSFRRGVVVFACGLGLQLASHVLAALGLMEDAMVIRFGILHLLGVCMILYPVLKKLPDTALFALGMGIIALGYWMNTLRVQVDFLYALGLCSPTFSSGDYFPILPHLGWFCIGITMGRRLYGRKKTLLPKFNEDFFLLRFFRFCGRHSLLIYLAHPPVIFVVCFCIAKLL